MQAISKNKYFMLSDLLDKDMWNYFANTLYSELDHCIFADDFDDTYINEKDLSLLKECSNPRTWKQFERSKRCRYKKRYNQLIEEYGKWKVKKHIKKGIAIKLADLFPNAFIN